MEPKNTISDLRAWYDEQYAQKEEKFDRSLSLGDYFNDRWDRAKREGFGEGTSVYDNVLIIGDVRVGKDCWIGPNCILDGSGGLEIGDHCAVSAGVHIYTHNSMKRITSMGAEKNELMATKIGSGVFIGPNSVLQMGVTIGDQVIIGAMSFVNIDIPSRTKAFGVPSKIIGSI